MSITITGRAIQRRGGDLHSTETLAQSTATQAASVSTDLTTFNAGTASSSRITLADGTEGQEKDFLLSGTGTVLVAPDNSTATGAFALTDTDGFLRFSYKGGKWRIIQSTATIAGAT